jgi:hypothetical protein
MSRIDHGTVLREVELCPPPIKQDRGRMNAPIDPQQSQQPPQPQSPQFPKDQADILKFLRDEAEQNRKAQREESDANRKLFLETSKIVAIPLAVLLTLAGIFFYRDVNTMKEAMKAEGEAEAKAEIKRMDEHIDQTLEERFKSENIQKTIQQAALDATSKQAPGLIKEVITPEVRKAVQDQSGTIKSVASQAATDEVKNTIEPVIADVKLQALTASATSDNAKSFDELVALRNSGTLTMSQKELISGVIANLEQHARDGVLQGGEYDKCTDPIGDEYKAMLMSPLTEVRKSAVAACASYMSMGQWVPRIPGNSVSAYAVMETIGPMWIKLAFNDPSLSVREEAITGLNSLFKRSPDAPLNGFDLLDTTYLKTWWAKHEADQAAFALVANGEGDPRLPKSDEIGLYDEAERLARASPRNQVLLESLREHMRSSAATPRISPVDLAKAMGRDCDGVQKDVAIRLDGFSKQLEKERTDTYGQLELQYLAANCTVNGVTLRQIASYGVSTRSLISRYAAAKIVNKSSGSSLDPYQSKPLEDWLTNHKSN